MERINDSRGTEAAQSAAEAVRMWTEARSRLSPVIGDQGFVLLYKRSVHLASSSFPWLAGEPGKTTVPLPLPNPSFDACLAALAARLERKTPEQAAEASRALFATFTALLDSLIGVGLTTHLLASVTPGDSSYKTREPPPQEGPK